jgi:hypothetical protein
MTSPCSVCHRVHPGACKPHQCKPSKLAGMTAHRAAPGSRVVCDCGRRWQVTKTHHEGGRICGCGWALMDPADTIPVASTKGLPKKRTA